MDGGDNSFIIKVSGTDRHCPAGEEAGNRYRLEGRIPVLSCEGPCIRGEIARVAANLVARQTPFRRGCHGELMTVPGSAIAQWIRTAEQVVLIDGCFLRCHGRMIEHLIPKDRLVQFNAHSYYQKFNENFDIDEVPEAERAAAARLVAEAVLGELRLTAATAACSAGPASGARSGCGCS